MKQPQSPGSHVQQIRCACGLLQQNQVKIQIQSMNLDRYVNIDIPDMCEKDFLYLDGK